MGINPNNYNYLQKRKEQPAGKRKQTELIHVTMVGW